MGISDRFKRIENTTVDKETLMGFSREEFLPDFYEESTLTLDLEDYMNDENVTKIVIIDKNVTIYHDDKLAENLTLENAAQNFVKNSVDKYIKNNFIVSVVCPPVSEKICVILEKIRTLSPEDLVKKNIVQEDTFNFLGKCIKNRKNILIANNDNLLTTIISYSLEGHQTTLLQELPKVINNDNVIAFTIDGLQAKDFENVLEMTKNLNSEYLLSDIKDEINLRRLICDTHDENGKIFAVNAPNAQGALFRVLNMIMQEEHCNEKIAKSKLLKSFNYIIDKERIYLIAPAKTAVITLKAVE